MEFPDDAQKRAKGRQKSTPAYLSGVIKSSPVLSEYLFVSLPFYITMVKTHSLSTFPFSFIRYTALT